MKINLLLLCMKGGREGGSEFAGLTFGNDTPVSLVKDFSQSEQEHGLSPVCTLVCLARLGQSVKDLV